MALVSAGYREEAQAWRTLLHRTVAGSPNQLQIMYGLSGERQLIEWEVPSLPGYHGAAPVRIGNAASGQLRLDVYGELIDATCQARKCVLAPVESAWARARKRTIIGAPGESGLVFRAIRLETPIRLHLKWEV